MTERHPLDEHQRRVMQGYLVWWTNRTFVPPTDVIEYSDRVVVRVEIAGVRAQDISVALEKGVLTVSGARERTMEPGAAYHQVEIGYGEFRVPVTLPVRVMADGVTAVYKDGILQVELPLTTVDQSVIIPVRDEEQDEDARNSE